MIRAVHLLASNTLTLIGMALLAISVWRLQEDAAALWPMLSAFGLLALNLCAALLTHPRLRQDRGLLILHLSLLALLTLAGTGRLARFEAQVELVDGQSLAAALPVETLRGPWHRGSLDEVDFTQGYFTVDYAPGLRRSDTRSQVKLRGESHWVGDEDALVLDGYRFYTTHNKGYAVLLTWQPEHGQSQSGAVHMPGYPFFAGHQKNRFSPRAGAWLDLTLQLPEAVQGGHAWRLDSRQAGGTLLIEHDGQRKVLAAGETLTLPDGKLRFDAVRGWMGYKVFYDPTLTWLMLSVVLALAGLLWHLLQSRFGKRKSQSREVMGYVT
jgi:cytochrome c biogenesis protein